MLPQLKKGFTTVVDLADFERITWSYLTNVKMTWEYDGMAYLFRAKGIPLYGKDLGSLKMNHPIVTMAVPQSKDVNYGVDIYVPSERLEEARSLTGDEERLKECARKEAIEGDEAHREFDQRARAARQQSEKARFDSRRGKAQTFVTPSSLRAWFHL